MSKWRVLSLFSGIGGLELGLERAGMQVVGQCEMDPFCCAVLEKHWPSVPRWSDVRSVTGADVRERCGAVDVVCGGFPCQDISSAGKGAGLVGERSGLWFEMLRVVREVEPLFVIAENVPALRSRGADIVLRGLEEAGYTAGAFVVGADDMGAPHRRKRVFIVGRRVAHSDERGLGAQCERVGAQGSVAREHHGHVADANAAGRASEGSLRGYALPRWPPGPGDRDAWARVLAIEPGLAPAHEEAQPEIRGVASGLSPRLARRWRRRALKALGNAVVPAVAYVIGRAVMEAEAAS